MTFLSDKEVQRHLIETAEKLAKKTNNKTDDEIKKALAGSKTIEPKKMSKKTKHSTMMGGAY